MLIFYQKQKFIIFFNQNKKTRGGGFGVGAGGDENLIINFYWPYHISHIASTG